MYGWMYAARASNMFCKAFQKSRGSSAGSRGSVGEAARGGPSAEAPAPPKTTCTFYLNTAYDYADELLY